MGVEWMRVQYILYKKKHSSLLENTCIQRRNVYKKKEETTRVLPPYIISHSGPRRFSKGVWFSQYYIVEYNITFDWSRQFVFSEQGNRMMRVKYIEHRVGNKNKIGRHEGWQRRWSKTRGDVREWRVYGETGGGGEQSGLSGVLKKKPMTSREQGK